MIDINDEVKQHGRERNVVFRRIKGNYSNPHRDGHHQRVVAETSATLEVNSAESVKPAPDTHMITSAKFTVGFSSKSSLDMVARGLEDLKALFEMRVNEAKEAGDTLAADTAATELQVVMEALVVLCTASTLSP